MVHGVVLKWFFSVPPKVRRFGIRKTPNKLVISLLFCNCIVEKSITYKHVAIITTDKVTEIFCVLDDFCKNLDTELTKNLHIAPWTRDISE